MTNKDSMTELELTDPIASLYIERDRLLHHLRSVMAHLRTVGGDPSEHAAFRAAFDEIKKYGDPEHEAAVRKWEEREAKREAGAL